jgi:hypothetical protein
MLLDRGHPAEDGVLADLDVAPIMALLTSTHAVATTQSCATCADIIRKQFAPARVRRARGRAAVDRIYARG